MVFVTCLVLVVTSGAPNHLEAQGKKQGSGGPKHVFAGPPPDHPFDLILARPTDKSVTLSVMAYQELTVRVSYGLNAGKHDGQTPERMLKKGELTEYVLTGLKPDSQYSYRLHTRTSTAKDFTPEDEHTFHTQRSPGRAFTFTIQSDSHLDQATRPAVYERTLANALADKPDFHIDLGDTFMTDKYDKYQDALPQYIAQRYYFGRIAHSAPLFLVLGNHDGERVDYYDGTANCMPVWANRTRKKYFPNPSPDGFYTGNSTEVKHVGRVENYYAWEWGDALIVALDPFWTTPRVGRNNAEGNWGRTLGKEQYDWLAKTLAQSKAKFKFVFIHHLVGGIDHSARGGSEAAVLYEWGGKGKENKDEFKSNRPGWEMPIHQLLVKHKVSVVFHGHDHFFAKQDLDTITYLMVPQPGNVGGERLRNVDEYGYIRGDFLPPSGHIRVHVSGDKASVEYVRTLLPVAETSTKKNGYVAHSFTLRP